MNFQNRTQAGILLADELKKEKNAVVLSIPRGGVVVGKAVSEILKFPLNVVITRKIGAPSNPELAIGAVAEGDIIELDKSMVEQTLSTQDYINREIEQKKKEIEERKSQFRQNKNIPSLKGKTAIIVDDGIATGATTIAAILAVKKKNPKKIILAVPVAPKDTIKKLKPLVDELICLEIPETFYAVGQFFNQWEEVTNEQVKELLSK